MSNISYQIYVKEIFTAHKINDKIKFYTIL